MAKPKREKAEEQQSKPQKKHGPATGGDSSRTQKGNPSEKAKGKAEGRK